MWVLAFLKENHGEVPTRRGAGYDVANINTVEGGVGWGGGGIVGEGGRRKSFQIHTLPSPAISPDLSPLA